jgi:hypothetical protein
LPCWESVHIESAMQLMIELAKALDKKKLEDLTII